jgi:galactose-1-phosphate uridylyltransferase
MTYYRGDGVEETVTPPTITLTPGTSCGSFPVPTIHGSAPVYAALGTEIPSKEHKSELHLGKFTKQERKEHAALRRKHITITKQPLGCGHRFAVGQVPRNNCDACWLTHFRTIPGLRWTDDAGKPYDSVSSELIAEVTATRGEKYAKRLRWYLAVNAALHTVRPELAAK